MNSYKLKVKLEGSEPVVTRTVSVPKDITFRDLHEILQIAMGWGNMHFYEFEIKSNHMLIGPKGSMDMLVHREDDRLTPLSDFEYRNFRYIYDGGDYWVHDIHFLKDTDLDVPKVLKYTEDCPPEDSGGIIGYRRMMEILSDPDNPEYETMRERYEDTHCDYDIDDVNRRLENEWTRFDTSRIVSQQTFELIRDAMEAHDGRDWFLDPERMETVSFEPGKVHDDGLIPISHASDPVILSMMDGFLAKRRSLMRKVGMNTGSKARYRRFLSIVEKDNELRSEWYEHLDRSTYDLALRWVDTNGLEVESSVTDIGPMDIKGIMDGFLKTLMGMKDRTALDSEMYMCPDCGKMSSATLDTKGTPTPICGTVSYPATLWCDKCKTHTTLRKLNDGFYIGHTYEGWLHPCKMVEPVMKRYFDAVSEPDPDRRFDKCASIYTSLYRLNMNPELQKVCDIMRTSVKEGDAIRNAILGVIDDIHSSGMPSKLDMDTLRSLPRQFAAWYVSMVENESEDFPEVERMHAFAGELFSTWKDRDVDYFHLHMLELLCYTVDEKPVDASEEVLALLREAIAYCRDNPRPYDDMQMQLASIFDGLLCRLWDMGFNDTVREMVTIMEGYITNPGRDIPYAMQSIFRFRKGMVDLTLGDGIDSARGSFEAVVEIHDTLKDAGPFTVFRSMISTMVLYRHGLLDEKGLARIIAAVPTLFLNKTIDKHDVVELLSYAMYAYMRNKPFKDAKDFVFDHTGVILDIDEDGVLDLWDGDMRLWNISVGEYRA